MKFKFRRLAALLTSSLLVAGGLVGLAAAPAQAAPTVTDFSTWSVINDFGGNAASATSVGVPSGAPTATGNALKVVKGTAQSPSETWAGSTFVSLSGSEFISTDPNSSLSVSAEVYTSTAGVIRLKLEDQANGADNVEQQVSTAVGWQTITWDFSTTLAGAGVFAEAKTYNLATIFFDFGTVGNGNIYWLDNFSYTPHAVAQAPSVQHPQILSTFETSDTNTYDTNAVCSTQAEVTSAPPVGGSSGSLKAGKVTTVGGGCDAYPLWTFMNINAGNSLISSTNSTVTMNFYSPAASNVMLKIETANGATFKEANTTAVAGWQTLTFTFSSVSDSVEFRKASIFPRFNNMTPQAGVTYYIDDVAFNGATTPAITVSGISTPTVNYDVRLIASQRNTATDAYQWTECGGQSWCVDNNYYMKMVEAGSTTTLTYVVTEQGTNNLVNGAVVRLRMNTGYSGSNATWSSGGNAFAAVASTNPNDAGYISATSNAQGEVSFTFTNTNTNGEAARTLNNANPYPAGCLSPAGQTKAALQPTVYSVSGAIVGTQRVDVLWPHVYSATINSSIAAGSDGTNCGVSGTSAIPTENKGAYPHIRLDKQFLDTNYDASWWDGVWQYRDADTKAYLKYIPVGSTFKLTYYVTDASNQPLPDAPVSLIVNANYSCSKTFFLYENSLIGPDDCAGGGQTELPAKLTDRDGKVTFVLTNTNATGEKMPADLNGLPNGPELGTNIRPNLVGATQQGIDMLFAHFVEPSEKAKVTAPAEATVKAGQSHWSTFTFTDENGKPMVGELVQYLINGFQSKMGYKYTDAKGQVTVQSNNFGTSEGTQAVAVSLTRPMKLPLTATATINWTEAEVAVAAAGGKRFVTVKAMNAVGKVVKIVVDGKTFIRRPATDSATFRIAATSGKKKVTVSVGKVKTSKTVSVTR